MKVSMEAGYEVDEEEHLRRNLKLDSVRVCWGGSEAKYYV